MEKSSSSSSTSSSLSSSRSLEITIISAEDLRNKGSSIEKVFVTVETSPNHSTSTSMDSEGGSFPYWNNKLDVTLPYNVKHIRLDVKCLSNILGLVTIIGSASIPVSDFLEDYVPPHCLHYVSYRLISPNGNRNGIINFSIRMKGLDQYNPPMLPTMGNQQVAGTSSSSYASGSMPLSVSGIQVSAPYENNRGTSAIGIPVSKGYGF